MLPNVDFFANLHFFCSCHVVPAPQRDIVPGMQKLIETDTWQRGDYVEKQGWATMPYEKEPDSAVADKCVEQIMQIGQ